MVFAEKRFLFLLFCRPDGIAFYPGIIWAAANNRAAGNFRHISKGFCSASYAGPYYKSLNFNPFDLRFLV